MANKNRNGKREAYWQGVLMRHAKSGLSGRAFCRRENLSEPSFYAWRRTLRERDTTGQHSPRPAFLPAAILPPAIRDVARPGGSIVIDLCSGRTLRLPESTSASRVAELVHALETGHLVAEASP
jgi:transposase-like protein